ncbi:MAG: signal recognition particle protein [Saccharofermentans sp.]|jgi:signal recognition particle subunit SRP54|nr:signal recognition particle protein [Saccharofermentans sp.]
MRGKARVSDSDIKEMMREIRMALLEADVNYGVVKEFVADMTEKCKGADVMESFTPGQQIVKIVRDSLTELLGGEDGEDKLKVSSTGFNTIILYGLQGAGKTTTAAKLAKLLKENGKKPMVVSVDVHRPAAAQQLKVLSDSVGVDCYIDPEEKDAVKIARDGEGKARYMLCNYLIIDTAGRTVADEELMEELRDIADAVNPTEKLLVVDAMIGQEAVNVAQLFEQNIGMDGFIMTKLDGDARGGAALSIRKLTNKPIKYICTGEKVDAIERFYPQRMADRILGMGDVVSLIEKAQQNIDEEEARKAMERMMSSSFTLDDLYSQFEQMKKMGSLKDLVGMVPGAAGKVNEDDLDDKIVDRQMAIITSMTKKERRAPQILNASRRKRIAAGAGVQVSDVNKLISQYEQTAKLMKQFSNGKGGFKMPKGFARQAAKMGLKGNMGGMGGLGNMGGMSGMGQGFPQGLGSLSAPKEDYDDYSAGAPTGRRDRKKKRKGRR